MLKYIFLLSFLMLDCIYGENQKLSTSQNEPIEEKALDYFINELFKYHELQEDAFIFNYNLEIINGIFGEFQSKRMLFFSNGIASEYTPPYVDSVTYYFNVHEGSYSEEEKKEVEDLFLDYLKKKDKNDVVLDDEGLYIKMSYETFKNDFEEFGYYIQLYKHIESHENYYVKIQLIGKEMTYDFFLVFQKQDYSFLRFYLESFQNG